MTTFYNQATLSYNGTVTNSNVATGELLDVLTATKTAVLDEYGANDNITFIISIVNAGTTPFTGLTITDKLGGYPFGAATLYPLTYVAGSILYYMSGDIQAAPVVLAGPPLVISGINVPAGGNAIIIYETQVNQFAPLGVDGTIENDAQITGGGLSDPISVSDTILTEDQPNLTISKSVCPSTVAENGQLTYTFNILNYGNTPAVAADLVKITDTFDPILNPITVALNGTPWVVAINYTYDSVLGKFATIAGQITVPAANFTQDLVAGNWIVNPGVSVLTVTGTV